MRKITFEIAGKEFYNTAKHIERARLKVNDELKIEEEGFYKTGELWAFHLLKEQITFEEFEEWMFTLNNEEYSNLTTFASRMQNELGKLITHYMQPQLKQGE